MGIQEFSLILCGNPGIFPHCLWELRNFLQFCGNSGIFPDIQPKIPQAQLEAVPCFFLGANPRSQPAIEFWKEKVPPDPFFSPG